MAEFHRKRLENAKTQRPRLPDKDMDHLVSFAWEAGAWCERQGNKHVAVYPVDPSKRMIPIPNEHQYFIELKFDHEVNGPWLEKMAIEVESALASELSGRVLGPSVTANPGSNAFEIDVTIAADSIGDVHKSIGDLMNVVLRVTGAEFVSRADDSTSEIRSGLHGGPQGEHERLITTSA